jgi:hypothetical protein
MLKSTSNNIQYEKNALTQLSASSTNPPSIGRTTTNTTPEQSQTNNHATTYLHARENERGNLSQVLQIPFR